MEEEHNNREYQFFSFPHPAWLTAIGKGLMLIGLILAATLTYFHKPDPEMTAFWLLPWIAILNLFILSVPLFTNNDLQKGHKASLHRWGSLFWNPLVALPMAVLGYISVSHFLWAWIVWYTGLFYWVLGFSNLPSNIDEINKLTQ